MDEFDKYIDKIEPSNIQSYIRNKVCMLSFQRIYKGKNNDRNSKKRKYGLY